MGLVRFNSLRMYVLKTGRVVVFRPFGRYVFFSNLALAIEMYCRKLTPDTQRDELLSLEDTAILNLDAA